MTDASSPCFKTQEGEQLPIFVINLDSDDRRLAAMREQLDSFELKWERVSAVDGTALPAQVLLQENRRARPRKLSAGEIGCLHSHVAVWKRIAEGREPAALVLEDDVLMAPDVASLVSNPSWLVDSDCIVRLETFDMSVVLGRQVKEVHGRGLYPLHSIHHGAAAYIVTKSRAQLLLHKYHSYIDTADHLTFRYPESNNVYQISPAPCIQRDIHQHGRLGATSLLESHRYRIQCKSLLEPLTMVRYLMWRVSSVVRIGSDMIRGYSFQIVPYK